MGLFCWKILFIFAVIFIKIGSSQTCPNHQFQCSSESPCADFNDLCDGTAQCDGETDEQNCDGNCADDEFECNSGACIPLHMRCNRRQDCVGNDDEVNCTISEGCRYHEYQCQPSGTCISLWAICFQFVCPLNDVQPICDSQCDPDEIVCGNGACIAPEYRCDNIVDCLTGEDEAGCDEIIVDENGCTERRYSCGADCRSLDKACSYHAGCSSPAEFASLCSGNCGADKFECRSGFCIPQKFVCDGYHDCYDFDDDEANCDAPGLNQTCPNHQFQCSSEVPCADNDVLCDGTATCDGGIDEQNCDGNCADDEYECASGACIPSYMKCNRRQDCAGHDDEANCTISSGCRYHEYQCLPSGSCIPIAAMCFPNICPIGDDPPPCDGECGADKYMCGNGACIEEEYHCDNTVDCLSGDDETGCGDIIVDSDGCTAREYICGDTCQLLFHACSYYGNCSSEAEFASLCSGNCGPDEFECRSGSCIPQKFVCDGFHDCRDFDDDEANCETPVISTNCSSNGVSASIPGSYVRSLLPEAGYQLQMVGDDLRPLADCSATMNNETDKYEMSFQSEMGQCSANINESDTEIVVTYKILIVRSTTSQMISRTEHRPTVVFQCCYAKSGVVSMHQPLLALISHVEVNLGKTSSSFTMEMARYTSDTFATVENAQAITIGSPVYIGVKIDVEPDTDMVLQGITCEVRPSENETGVVYLVVNECCVVEDLLTANVNVIYNLTDPRVFGFSFQGFGWAGDRDAEQKLWVSCFMDICETTESNSCEIDCPPPQPAPLKKRSVTSKGDEIEKKISIGPFVLAPELVSDDQPTCDKEKLGCSHHCVVDTTGSAHCFCPEGYFLDDDGKSCLEVEQGNAALIDLSPVSFLFLLMMMMILILAAAMVIRKKDPKKLGI